MRSWSRATSSFDGTVTIATVRIHSPFCGWRQFSHKPPIANGARSSIATAKGCFVRAPLTARHSKKQSTGTMQRLCVPKTYTRM